MTGIITEAFRKIFIASLTFASLSYHAPIEAPWRAVQTGVQTNKHEFRESQIIAQYQNLNFRSSGVPVLMFHKIGEREDRYTISPENFGQIIESLIQNKFVPVSLRQFREGDFSGMPVGSKPVLLTFDDASEGQLHFQGETWIPTPDCAVGIFNSLKSKYKGFQPKATFFLSFSGDDHVYRPAFIDKGKEETKIRYLHLNGYDVGWHTPLHENNEFATPNDIMRQSAFLDALIYKSVGEFSYLDILEQKSYAHPFGAVPKRTDTKNLLIESYEMCFNAWGGISPHPLSKEFDRKAVPRIEIHMSNIDKVMSDKSNYKVSFADSIFFHNKSTPEKKITLQDSLFLSTSGLSR